MCDEHVKVGGNLREPALQHVRFALESPRVGNDRNPRRPVELDAVDFRPPVAKEMDVWRELVLPVDSMPLEEYVSNRIEVVVAGDDDELDVGIRCRPFLELPVDPLLLVVDVPRSAPAQRRDVARQHNNVRAFGVKPLKVAMQVRCRHYSHCDASFPQRPSARSILEYIFTMVA